MKNHIYNRYVECQRRISESIERMQYTQAYDLDYDAVWDFCLKPLNEVKSPEFLKGEIKAILWFLWKKESNKLIFPTIYEGKLYNGKWDKLSDELKRAKMSTEFKLPYLKMWPHHFTEGMELTPVMELKCSIQN